MFWMGFGAGILTTIIFQVVIIKWMTNDIVG